MPDEKCVCHVNGYRVKDSAARKMAEDANKAAKNASSTAAATLRNFNTLEGKVEDIKKTADTAAAAAKTAYNTANAALPKSGGSMNGHINMEGKDINNVSNLEVDVLFLQNNNTGNEVTVESQTTAGVVNFMYWKNPEPDDVILRGVADPTEDNDAASKAYVDSKSGPDMVIKIFGREVIVARGSYAAVADKLRNADPPVVHVIEMSYQSFGSGENAYAAAPQRVESVTLWDYTKEPHLDISARDGEVQIFVFEDNSAEM